MSSPQRQMPSPASAYGARFRAWSWRHALSPTGNTGDAIFRMLLFCCALLLLLIVSAMILAMASNSMLSIREFGWTFLIGREWNPIQNRFGALPFIYGTIVSSLIALFIAVPLSLGVAIFLVEQAPAALARPVAFLVELLAAIPSVVYGLWGIFVLAPFLREQVEPPLQRWLGWLPFFQGTVTGIGLFTGGVILGLGRAVGETMAVTMVIGNRPEISASLFAPSYTIASVIANEFTEATGDLYLSALIELGLILFLVTFVVNGVAKFLVWSVTRK